MNEVQGLFPHNNDTTWSLMEDIRTGTMQANDLFHLAYRETFEVLIEQGYSLSQITKRLNEWGYKTKRGEEWTRENVHKVLKELGLKTQKGVAAGMKTVRGSAAYERSAAERVLLHD